jgi:hypothetical protein
MSATESQLFLSDEDVLKLRQYKKRSMIGMTVFAFLFYALLYVFGFRKMDNMIGMIFLVVFTLTSLGVFIYIYLYVTRRVKLDIENGFKKNIKGEITGKTKVGRESYKEKRTLGQNYLFHFGDKEIFVDYYTFKLYNVTDSVEIEIAPNSGLVLYARKLN